MFLPVSVCLFGCPLDYSEWILIKFFGGVGDPKNDQLDFGGERDHDAMYILFKITGSGSHHDPDPGIFKRI